MATRKATSVTKKTETVKTAKESVKETPVTDKLAGDAAETGLKEKPAEAALEEKAAEIEVKVPEKKAPAKKSVKTASAKKETAVKKETAAKKEPAAKKETSVKKETVKKTPAKTPAKKEIKVNTIVEDHGRQIEESTIIANVKKAWTASGKKIGDIKSIELYIKPEENAVYYVVNKTETGSVALYE